MTDVRQTDDIESVISQWEEALANHDAEGLLATYAEDATLESPLVPHILSQKDGLVRGHAELGPFFEEVVRRTPEIRHYHRGSFFTDGKRAMWEYPRAAPDGEQMDFVEVMEFEHGRIKHHRVYWGWRGVSVMLDDAYHR